MEFFCTVNGTPRNVPLSQMKFRVPGTLAALVGTWVDGRPWLPDPAAFRAALPFRWRKAFDRDGAFWHGEGSAYVTLRDRRGRYLATVYCNPVMPRSVPASAADTGALNCQNERPSRVAHTTN